MIKLARIWSLSGSIPSVNWWTMRTFGGSFSRNDRALEDIQRRVHVGRMHVPQLRPRHLSPAHVELGVQRQVDVGLTQERPQVFELLLDARPAGLDVEHQQEASGARIIEDRALSEKSVGQRMCRIVIMVGSLHFLNVAGGSGHRS